MFRCNATSSGGSLLPVVAACLLLAGCTHLFFWPSRQQFLSPESLGLHATDITLHARDGTRLFAWHLLADAPRGVVCFFHGNAQNISAHVLSVAWLPEAGHEVLLLDYRGYGVSEGKPSVPGALEDVRAGLDWCLARAARLDVPAYAFGQSLGASLVLEVVADEPYREKLAGVVADSAFAGYRRIARDALSGSRMLSPLKHPLSWLVTARHDPVEAVARRGKLPLLLMHSPDDEVIPFRHAGLLESAASRPVCFVATTGRHNEAFRGQSAREAMLMFLSATEKAGRAGMLACPAPGSHAR